MLFFCYVLFEPTATQAQGYGQGTGYEAGALGMGLEGLLRAGPDAVVQGLRGRGAGEAGADPQIRRSQQSDRSRLSACAPSMPGGADMPPPLTPGTFPHFVEQKTGGRQKIFGEDLFVSSQFIDPVTAQPAPSSYLIGPGDEIQIKIVGASVDFERRVIVDRAGTINLPRLGPISVQGIRAADLSAHLRKEVSKVLSEFQLFATVGALRSIEIFLVGQAKQPGKHLVSGYSSVINAIFQTCGPANNGSMRAIELIRGGQVITTVDLYSFVLRGDTSRDMRLISGDIINIRPAGPRVALLGATPGAAIYELLPLPTATSISDLLEWSGGLPVTVSPQRLTLERIDPSLGRPLSAESISLDTSGLKTPLKDGDILTLFPVRQAFSNAITLKILDSPPERLPLAVGARISSVIPNVEELLTREFWARRYEVNPPRSLPGSHKKALTNSTELDRANAVTAREASAMPRESDRQEDARAGARLSRAEQEASLTPSITARERRLPEQLSALDRFRDRAQMHLINWDLALVERVNQKDLSTQVISFNLRRALVEKDPEHDLRLQPGDVVTILGHSDVPLADSKRPRIVQLNGEVVSPGLYQLRQGETLPELISRAGGFSPTAYVYGLELSRRSVREAQNKNKELFIRRLEARTASTNLDAGAIDANTLATTREMRERNQQMIREQIFSLREATPSGRVILGLNPGSAKLPNLTLEDGDQIAVPAIPGHVTSTGAVLNEGTLIYRPGKRIGDYLKSAGLSNTADKDNTFIIRADGTVVAPSRGGWLSLPDWMGNSVSNAELMPGDTIVVPEEMDRFSAYSSVVRNSIKDWTQIVYQLGLSAATIKILNR